MDEFADIAKRMKELQLERDKPFAIPLQPDFHEELNAKLLENPVVAIKSLREIDTQYNQAELEKLHIIVDW